MSEKLVQCEPSRSHASAWGWNPAVPEWGPGRAGNATGTSGHRGLAPNDRPRNTVTVPDPRTAEFVGWVLAQVGLRAEAYRWPCLHRRVPACLRQLRVRTMEAARAELESRPHRRAAAISALLLGVTEFFRDQPVFDSLERSVLPELVRRRGRGLEVLSVGVSDGQELYSIGMLLDELGVLSTSLLWGVDCRADAVSRARMGVYRGTRLGGVDGERHGRYFRPLSSDWCMVVPLLRQRTGFFVRNVLTREESGGLLETRRWDVVLCRNLVMYVEEPAARGLWDWLAEQVAEDGILVTGRAECPPRDLPFRPGSRCVYQKVGLGIT